MKKKKSVIGSPYNAHNNSEACAYSVPKFASCNFPCYRLILLLFDFCCFLDACYKIPCYLHEPMFGRLLLPAQQLKQNHCDKRIFGLDSCVLDCVVDVLPTPTCTVQS